MESIESETTSTTTEPVVELGKMKVVYFGNEFPQDDLGAIFRRLHQHSKDKRHPSLARFIQEATLVMREEVCLMPASWRVLVPPFETVFNLANHVELRSGPLGAAIDGMLLCAVQLATLIGYYENTAEDTLDFPESGSYLTGLGTGLLTAVALSLSFTLADLPLAGAEVIRIAFRLGVLVAEVSSNLQPPLPYGGRPESWAYTVPRVTAEEIRKELDAFQTAEKTPDTSKIFISAISRTSVTVSGPPARLKHLFLVSDFFRDRKPAPIPLPVYGGLCHADHIYAKEHVDRIFQGNSLSALGAGFQSRVPVLSTSNGRPFQAASPLSLFRNVVEEILTQTIQWDTVIQGIVQRAAGIAGSQRLVLMIGNSLPVRDLVQALDSELLQIKTLTKDLVRWIATPEALPRRPRGTQQAKIAIVGMACRLPGGATDTEKFWEILSQGADVHRKIPADRFDVETHCDPTGKSVNTSLTPYGCFIDEPGLFDAPFFNMSPREALQTDPMQRLALVTAYEALERAGYVPNRTAATDLHRVSTFYGQASDDYREVNTAQEIGTYFITGGCRAFGPGRINYFFKFSGPSYNIDTACSSGLAAIHLACNSLWAGDTDMAVTGGMNVLTNSDAFAGLSKGHFLSKTSCKTWDCEADGYCRADGVVSVILKRLEDAETDNDNILGVILAAGTNHSAEAISITHPHAGHQAFLTRQILDQASIDPLDVSYVEMHGTGTQAGDAQEIQSVTDVFAPLTSSKSRSPRNPLHIGAVKANVGHGEAVAGTTALLKVLLMFEKEAIPPHAGIKNAINPDFPKDLDKRNLHIPFQKTPWARAPEKRRIAVVNNFSAAGGNTSIVIEEAPARLNNKRDAGMVHSRSTHVVAVSAKSKTSLKGNLQRLITYLEANPDVSLPDLAYTTTARRQHHSYRVAVATPGVADLKKQLTSHFQSAETHKPIHPTEPPPIVFTFTGQGASYRSMNLELFHESPCFRSHLLHLDSLCQAQGFPSFLAAINGSYPRDHTHSPTVTQLSLLCIELALVKYWDSLGVRPDVVIGHSLGEYAAMCVAGVLSVADAIHLVGQRARMLDRKCQTGAYKMLAVRASLEEVESKANGRPFEVACLNGPNDTVLSGTVDEIKALVEQLEAAGLKCIYLDVSFAFHSAQMDPILDELEETVRTGVVFQPPNLPIISPLLGKVIFDDKTINANYIRRSTREVVNFKGAVEVARSISIVDETMLWIEIGLHPVCVSFARSIIPSIKMALPSLRRGQDNWQTLSHSLAAVHTAGVQVRWNEFHRAFEGNLRLLDLPTYAWNDKNYWLQYNGDWALTKGNTFYDAEKKAAAGATHQLAAPASNLRTSLVHRVVDETFSGVAGRVVIQSDMMQADFLKAAWGHQMNGAGVVTSSIHADIAWTLGKYLINKLKPGDDKSVVDMDISSLVVREGLVAQKNTNVAQLIQVSITTADIESGLAHLEWHNVTNDGRSLVDEEPIVTAQIVYGNASTWLHRWVPSLHLIQGRIDALSSLADKCVANRLSHNMAYLLFAQNLVDYADQYRGMQSVVMHELEAFAEVTLKTNNNGGTWTVPPFFIDSVFHLAGFVMNVSDASDTKNSFCVTPGWESLRMARPLVAGSSYRSYVKMIPTVQDPTVYLGDVYVLQNDEIIGVMQGMKFRRYPRVLLNRFFSPADVKNSASGSNTITAHTSGTLVAKPAAVPTDWAHDTAKPVKPQAIPTTSPGKPVPPPPTVVKKAIVPASDSSIVTQAMALIASEAAIELSDLLDDASFTSIGIDSLMSLVIAEKFREQFGITVSGSLFVEYPTVGNLRAWLIEYYG